MVDGVAGLTAMFHGLLRSGHWSTARESNLLDGAAPFYRTYETADGRYLAVGALEPQFYAELLDRLGLPAADWPQHDRDRWPAQRQELAGLFRTRTRAEWEAVFAASDACVTPVLSFAEAAAHPHLATRSTLVDVGGAVQPAPAPRFSRSGTADPGPPAARRADTDAVLAGLGATAAEIEEWRRDGIVA
jgi:alpha-methylacyl-CoA racemase